MLGRGTSRPWVEPRISQAATVAVLASVAVVGCARPLLGAAGPAATPPPEPAWWVTLDGRVVHLDLQEMLAHISVDAVRGGTLVHRVGGSGWAPAGDDPDLLEAIYRREREREREAARRLDYDFAVRGDDAEQCRGYCAAARDACITTEVDNEVCHERGDRCDTRCAHAFRTQLHSPSGRDFGLACLIPLRVCW